jgi:phage-related protein (TIGR01555 family)
MFGRFKKKSEPDQRQVAMDSLTNLIAGLNGPGDKQSSAFYRTATVMSSETCASMFRTSWAAGKIARIPAEDMLREGWDIDSGSLTAKQVQEVSKATEALALNRKLYEAIAYGRVYGGSFIVIGNTRKRNDWANPLRDSEFRQGDTMTLTLLDRTMLEPDITSINRDPGSEDFGKPMRYRVSDGLVYIHRTRMLEFIGKPVPYREYERNGYWNDSVYRDSEDAIKRYDTVASVINTMLYEATVDTLSIDNLGNMLTTKTGTEQVQKRFAAVSQLKSVINTLVLDAKDKYEKVQPSFTGVNDIFNSFKSDVAGAADIPITRFFGQSPAGMSATGDSDMRNYLDTVKFRQTVDLKPKLQRIYRLLCLCLFGSAPDDLNIKFRSLWTDAPDVISKAELARAQASQIYTQMGAIQVATVTADLASREAYSGIGAEDERMAEEADGINNDPTDNSRSVHPEPEPTREDNNA